MKALPKSETFIIFLAASWEEVRWYPKTEEGDECGGGGDCFHVFLLGRFLVSIILDQVCYIGFSNLLNVC